MAENSYINLDNDTIEKVNDRMPPEEELQD